MSNTSAGRRDAELVKKTIQGRTKFTLINSNNLHSALEFEAFVLSGTDFSSILSGCWWPKGTPSV